MNIGLIGMSMLKRNHPASDDQLDESLASLNFYHLQLTGLAVLMIATGSQEDHALEGDAVSGIGETIAQIAAGIRRVSDLLDR